MLRALALVSVTLLVAPVHGQTLKDEPPLIAKLLPFIDDEAVGKELKLKPVQVRKLVDHRTKQWDEEGKDGVSKAKAKVLVALDGAAVELFKDVLDTGQHKRALQLATQYVWNTGEADRHRWLGAQDSVWSEEAFHEFVPVRMADPSRVPAYTLFHFPELANLLKPTDAQKKQFASDRELDTKVFLTAEQAKAAREAMGEPVKLTWREAVDPRYGPRFSRRGPSPTPVAPAIYTLLLAEDVQWDLGLSAEQFRVIKAVDGKWRPERGAGPGGFGGGFEWAARVPRGEALAKLLDETLDTMAKTLSPAQVSRLGQIERQQKSGIYGSTEPPLARRIHIPEVRTALALTAEQDKAVADAVEAHDATFRAAITSEKPVADILTTLAAARGVREKAIAAVLTPAQRTTLDELLGRPFAGSTLQRFARDPSGLLQTAQRRRADSFGLRTLGELYLLAENGQIQKAVGLKPEQVTKAVAVLEVETKKHRERFARGDAPSTAEEAKVRGEVSAFVSKVVGDMLSAEQAVRFRQLVLQHEECYIARGGVLNQSLGAISYPGIAAEIKLSDSQKARLVEGASSGAVLTGEQTAALAALLGEPFTGDWEPVYPAYVSNRIAPRNASVLFDNRWDTFHFTAAQTDKLAAVLNECQVMVEPGRRKPGDPPPDRGKLATVANETFEKAVAETLTPEQAVRLDQARLRALAAHSVAGFFNCPEVVKALSLSPEQVKNILAILGDVRRLRPAAMMSFGGRNAAGEWYQKLTEVEIARASAVLTDAQRTELKKRIGDPIPNLHVRLRAGASRFPSGSSKDGL